MKSEKSFTRVLNIVVKPKNYTQGSLETDDCICRPVFNAQPLKNVFQPVNQLTLMNTSVDNINVIIPDVHSLKSK